MNRGTMHGPWTNWAGNVTFTSGQLHRPASVGELQAVVASSERARALGTGHSFSRLADSPGALIWLAGLPQIVEVDAARAAVKVSAGLRYGELAVRLHERGYALRNLASLPHISVAGACATGTHGSGDANGSLATSVSAMEMVTAQGDLVTLRRDGDGDQFRGAVVGLGALGIATCLTLDIVPAFDIRQYVYQDIPSEQVNERFDDIFGSAYSVSLFTDWRGHLFRQMWLKRRADEYGSAAGPPPPRWLGARLADGPRHPVPGLPAAACTQQLGVPGPWHERLPHFRLDFTPSSGQELQSEYLVPRRHAVDALLAIGRLSDLVASLLQISEIRTVAADELWLSPSYRRDSVAIHFTWVKDAAAVAQVLAAIEDALAPFGARPHWGKLFGTSPAVLRGLYPRLGDFERLIRGYDQGGKFRNELMDAYFPGGQ